MSRHVTVDEKLTDEEAERLVDSGQAQDVIKQVCMYT
jgi:hypothetical protein